MRLIAAIGFLAISVLGAGKAQTPQAFVQSLAARQFILIGRGGDGDVKLNKNQLGRLSGHCDIAVSVATANWDQGKAEFLLQYAGSPQLMNAPRNVCTRIEDHITMRLTGFAADEPIASLSASIRQILQTPEEYVVAHGVAFDLPPGPDDEEPVKPPPPIINPVLLLRVDGAYSEEARRRRLGGNVTIKLVVGTDGRVHRPRVVHGLGSGLDEAALRALSFWRFEPARQLGKPVAHQATMQMTFHII